MKFEIKVDPAWEDFGKNLLNSSHIVDDIMKDAVQKSGFEVEAKAKIKAPIDTGRLRSSLHTRVETSPLSAFVGSDVEYAHYVHFGTSPHWPPFQEGTALADWAGHKGLDPFLVAKAIAFRGTKGQPFLFDALFDARNLVANVFEEAITLILQKLKT